MKLHEEKAISPFDAEFESALDAAGLPVYPQFPYAAQLENQTELQPEEYVTVYHPDKHWLRVLIGLSDLPMRLYMIMASRLDPDNLCEYPLDELAAITNTKPRQVEKALEEIFEVELARPIEPGKYGMNPAIFWRVQVAEFRISLKIMSPFTK
ncbi:hypothetical protein GCM10027299_42180 [Larkinella ripae]